ncbi:hypothetical protein ACLKA7_004263 [Drosophila subpalustris]
MEICYGELNINNRKKKGKTGCGAAPATSTGTATRDKDEDEDEQSISRVVSSPCLPQFACDLIDRLALATLPANGKFNCQSRPVAAPSPPARLAGCGAAPATSTGTATRDKDEDEDEQSISRVVSSPCLPQFACDLIDRLALATLPANGKFNCQSRPVAAPSPPARLGNWYITRLIRRLLAS